MKKKYEERILNGENGKIYLGIPRERVYIPLFVDNRDQVMVNLAKAKRACGIFQVDGHRVDRSRDMIVEAFLKHEEKPDWLLFLDSDMQHPADIGIRLSKWNKPIVGGLYFHRGNGHNPFVFMQDKDRKDKWDRDQPQWAPMRDLVYEFLQKHNIPMRDGAVAIDNPLETPLVECDAVATGAMIVHRSVFETMPGPWFEYRTLAISEDLMFCHEAKFDYGIPIHCDLSCISGHYVFVAIGHAEFRVQYEARGMTLSGYSKSEASKWLSEFSQTPEKETLEKINKGSACMVGDYWKSKFGKKTPTAEETKNFYLDPYTGQLYLIELLHWNFTQEFHYIRSKFLAIRNKKILEIGAGIGTLAMQLAIQNNDVLASEVNDTLRAFIDFRYLETKKQVVGYMKEVKTCAEEWLTLDPGSMDMVFAIDTLEHLDETTLLYYLTHIHEILKEGGHFAFHNNWKQQDLYPMHQDYSEKWAGWLENLGFMQINEFEAVKVK